MRADMGKVLVERPRLGRRRAEKWPGKGYRKRLKKCLDAGDAPPEREGIKRSYGHGTKHFNEHLGPLRRFLSANVGRPWNKVYSEICRHMDRGNVVQKHILTHLFEYVVVHTVLIDGQPCRGDASGHWRGYGESLRTSSRRDQWYVCPKSGLLRASRYVRWAPAVEPPPRTVKLNNKQLCVCRGGQWELISVALLWKCSDEPPAYEFFLEQQLKQPSVDANTVVYCHGDRYAVARRPLLRRELLALPIPIEWLWER